MLVRRTTARLQFATQTASNGDHDNEHACTLVSKSGQCAVCIFTIMHAQQRPSNLMAKPVKLSSVAATCVAPTLVEIIQVAGWRKALTVLRRRICKCIGGRIRRGGSGRVGRGIGGRICRAIRGRIRGNIRRRIRRSASQLQCWRHVAHRARDEALHAVTAQAE